LTLSRQRNLFSAAIHFELHSDC